MKRFVSAVAVAGVTFLFLPLAAQSAYATYPGKNGRIAISMDRGQGSEIYTIRPDGSDVTRITDLDVGAFDPDWSPDGAKIVFDVDLPGEPCRIWIMNADGSDIVDLTPKRVVANHACVTNPSFTPDGKRIVYLGKSCKIERRCPFFIRSMNIHGGDQRKILRTWNKRRIGLHVPHVSPDGRTIAFVVSDQSGVHGNRNALYTVRMNGTHLKQLVPYRLDVCECGSDWAPNGKRIVASDYIGNTTGEPPSNLFTIRPDGTGLRFLTDYRALNPHVNLAAGPYSPDGHWIVFKHSFYDKDRYVMLKVHPDGSGLTRIRTFKEGFYGRDWGARAS